MDTKKLTNVKLGKKVIDFTNKTIGRIKVHYITQLRSGKPIYWGTDLNSGISSTYTTAYLKSCVDHDDADGGYTEFHNKPKNFKDWTGEKVGDLTVIKFLGRRRSRWNEKGTINIMWLCKCSCGALVVMYTSNLSNENSKLSCEVCAKKKKGFVKRDNVIDTTNLRLLYFGIISRCRNVNNPLYYLYGACNITYTSEFKHFPIFVKILPDVPKELIGKPRAIGRIDPLKGYAPNNIKWVPADPDIESAMKQFFSKTK